MPTGACGINCDVCRLNVRGVCSTCGPGTSVAAKKKLEAQQRILGRPCAILDCARTNKLEYCLRDCRLFPCDNFENGPYPYGSGFLSMQKRRRLEKPKDTIPDEVKIVVPSDFWDELEKNDRTQIRTKALAMALPPNGLILPFLNHEILVDIDTRCLKIASAGGWTKFNDPMLELMTLVYLNHATQTPFTNSVVGAKDLKGAHFFQGPHELRVNRLIKRYGDDPDGFKQAAENMGGAATDMAEAAFRLKPFPRIPLYYLLWRGDGEFKPRVSILFDSSIEAHLPPDAIWGVAQLVTRILALGKWSPKLETISM